jgi:hypothetical protein
MGSIDYFTDSMPENHLAVILHGQQAKIDKRIEYLFIIKGYYSYGKSIQAKRNFFEKSFCPYCDIFFDFSIIIYLEYSLFF